jgi:farnesyl-diphosphate farnesyltransferase
MSDDPARPILDAPGADLAWCHEAVQGVSRTFALTVDVLDEPMSSYICLGYLVCRIADTVEDASHVPPAEQARLLRTYDDVLDPESQTTPATFREEVDEWLPTADENGDRGDDWTVVDETERVLATFQALPVDVRDAIVPPARELVSGMADFVERYGGEGGLRLRTRDELEEYCYYAAGTVGNLVTNLVTRGDLPDERERRLYDTAEEFGLLLQLVNVAKDVHDDYVTENNVYLPRDWLAAENVDQDGVIDPENRSGVAAVVSRTADFARTFLDDAQAYLEHVPLVDGNTLEAWAIPYLLAVGTLRELSETPERAVDGRGVKMSREEVFAVVAAVDDGDRESLAAYRDAISSGPFHRVAPTAD